MFEKDHTPMIVHLDDYRINEYLDGYLHPSEASTVEAHLEVCPSCTVRLENLLVVFCHLETLPDISLDRDLSSDIIAQIQPDSSLAIPLQWGLLAQGVFALIIMSLALSSLLKTWKPTLISFQFALEQQYSNILQVWLVDWSTKFSALQLSWEHLISGWQPPAIFETTQIIVWPIFLAAVLLFVVGNGLILSKIARNDRY